MKRTTLAFFVMALALTAAVGNSNDPLYGNIHITLWRLEKGPTEKRKKRFDLLLRDNATFHSIFYDEESRAYLLEVGILIGPQ